MKYKTFEIKAVVVETGYPESSPDCQSVNCTMCCEVLSPFLTEEELKSKKYIYSLIDVGADKPAFGIPKSKKGGCIYFNHDDKSCTIYEYRPLSCRQFDCRLGHHPKIPNMFE